MWTALAACHEALERRGDAIACYERAAAEAEAGGEGGGGGGGGAGEALLKLARLHAGYEGGAAAAQQCYARFCRTLGELSGGGGGGGGGGDAAEAFLFLAKAAAGEGRLEAAETYALKVVGIGGGAEEREARALLAQLREDAAEDLDELGAGMDLSG